MGSVQPEFNITTIETTLKELVRVYAPVGTTLLIVDSAYQWAVERDVDDDNPFRQAIAFPDHSLVVMSRTLTATDARASTSILTIGPFAQEALAKNLDRYARFVLLHEIAHLNGMLDERAADEWALTRLNQLLEEAGEDEIPQ